MSERPCQNAGRLRILRAMMDAGTLVIPNAPHSFAAEQYQAELEHQAARLVMVGVDPDVARAFVDLAAEASLSTGYSPCAWARKQVGRVYDAIAAGRPNPLKLDAPEIDWRPDETVPEDSYA